MRGGEKRHIITRRDVRKVLIWNPLVRMICIAGGIGLACCLTDEGSIDFSSVVVLVIGYVVAYVGALIDSWEWRKHVCEREEEGR